jgi:hypothetical protein
MILTGVSVGVGAGVGVSVGVIVGVGVVVGVSLGSVVAVGGIFEIADELFVFLPFVKYEQLEINTHMKVRIIRNNIGLLFLLFQNIILFPFPPLLRLWQ